MEIGTVESALNLLEKAGQALTTGPGFSIALVIGVLLAAIIFLSRRLRESQLQHAQDLQDYKELVERHFEDYRMLLRLNQQERTVTTQVAGVLDTMTEKINNSPLERGTRLLR